MIRIMIPKKKLLEKIFIEEYNLLKKRREEKKRRIGFGEKEEYENFRKDLIFIKDNKVTVKVNQKFGAEFSRNFTIAPQYQSNFPKIKSKDYKIELIDTKTFYPYSLGTCGGNHYRIFVFKANKIGNYNIKFDTHTVKVEVIE